MESYQFVRLIRPCVRALLEGVEGYPKHGNWHISSQKRGAYLLALELKRVGCPKEMTVTILLGWNEHKNFPPIPGYKTRSHVIDLVEWVYHKSSSKLSCHGILRNGGAALNGNIFDPICWENVGKTCSFHSAFQERKFSDDPLSPPDLRQYMQSGWPHYLQERNGIVADYAYRILTHLEAEGGLMPGDIIFVGFRELHMRYIRRRKDHISLQTICRAVKRLESEGLVEVAERGIGTIEARKANGYRRILPLPSPPTLGSKKSENGTH